MNVRRILTGVLVSVAAASWAGCNLPGRPQAGPEVPRPDEVQAFEVLYRHNCAGCHGANGQQGSATDLANPEYQAWIDDASLRRAIANGDKGSLMPAFDLSFGGTLTASQIDVLVHGLRAKWGTSNALGSAPPPYHALTPGVASRGEAIYLDACARCHGAAAEHPGFAGSILDPSFLALINAQTLRTTIVAGRPDIGQPDWRNDVPGHELTDAEVTDVTAWLIAQSPANPANANLDESGRSVEIKPVVRSNR
ncbi:MAG TPA: c-type cytochrome [Acidisarcina sp.]